MYKINLYQQKKTVFLNLNNFSKSIILSHLKLRIKANSSFYQNMLIINRWIKQVNYELLNTQNAKNE